MIYTKHRQGGPAVRRLLAVASLLLIAATSLRAQPLDSLVRLAIDTHPSAEAAQIAIRGADARASAASAWEPPSVGIEFRDLPASRPNSFTRGETMLMVEQMIPLFGQNKAMARAMKLGAQVGMATLARVRRDLRARVEREYYTLWLLDRRAELNEQGRRIAELLSKAVETQYTTGAARQTDLFKIRLEIERLASEMLEIDEEKGEARGRLNALLSRPLDIPIVVATPLRADTLPPFEVLAARITDHPELLEMTSMANMSQAEAEAELAMLRPMLMVRGGISYMPEGHVVREESLTTHGAAMESMGKIGLTVGAMISIPFAGWSRSGPEGKAESFKLEADETLRRRDAMRQDMLAMLRSAWADARKKAIRLQFYSTAQVPLLEKSLESQRIEYTTGRAQFSAVIDAYNTLLMARMDAVMQQMEYAMALSMITQLTGWEEGEK